MSVFNFQGDVQYYLGNDILKFEQNFIHVSNQNRTDKINSILENPTKLRQVLIFTGSLTSHTENLGCACASVLHT